MLTLVIGENNSGKSRWAEQYAAANREGRLVYLPTMIAADEPSLERIARHRRQRRGLGFITLELPLNLCQAEIEPDDTVLVEDISNLLANQLFAHQTAANTPAVPAQLQNLCGRCGQVIAVTIGGLQPSREYDAATNAYIAALNQLNAELADCAELVVEMAAGRPLVRKGAIPCRC